MCPYISRIQKQYFPPTATQEECGAQMENQKAWQEHVEVHKTKLMAKIINSVRWIVQHVHCALVRALTLQVRPLV